MKAKAILLWSWRVLVLVWLSFLTFLAVVLDDGYAHHGDVLCGLHERIQALEAGLGAQADEDLDLDCQVRSFRRRR